jgi:glucose/mannose-6-phosphate isomerase
MLDDANVLAQRNSQKDLDLAQIEYQQTQFDAEVVNGDHDNRSITNIIVAGMGGSALAASLAQSWLKPVLGVPMEVVRTYDLPNYVNGSSLVIVSSYSGNTEETVSCFEQAKAKGAQIAVITSGGKLLEYANADQIAHVVLPSGFQPRMALIYTLCSMAKLFVNFGIASGDIVDEIASTHDWLKEEGDKWASSVPTSNNYAKKLALHSVGKTSVFFGGAVTSPVAYKFKICCNETAKNVAYCNDFPEFNHNEFNGWISHPVEKPFAVFNVVSNLENPQILKRFEITDRLLSGMMPKPINIELQGDTLLKQLLWGAILTDFLSIYLATLNGVDPMSVELIEKFKKELAQS